MAFDKGLRDFNEYLSLLFIIFVKNILESYWYQSMEVATWVPIEIAVYLSVFSAVDWILFWFFFRNSFDSKKNLVFIMLITLVFVSLPYFIFNPVISYDHDNLFIKGISYFIPFAVFVFLKKSPQQIFLPIVMAFIPLVNLEIGNGFVGNPSYVNFLFKNANLVLSVNDHVFIDIAFALVKTLFWGGIVILFFEINHQFFAFKSWSLFVDLPLNKGYLLLVFVIFKTLIYWFIASLIIALLGNYSLPLFTNKVGLAFNFLGFLGMLSLCTLYFRKYLTLYFYDKCGHSNWLYPFFFIPVLDIFALIVLLALPPLLIKRVFGYKYSVKILVRSLIVLLIGFSFYAWYGQIRIIPEGQTSLKVSLIISQIFIPVISAIGIVLSERSSVAYKSLMVLFFVMLPVYFLFIINIDLVNALKVEELVKLVSVFLNIGLLIAFLYPVLNFKSFLKL